MAARERDEVVRPDPAGGLLASRMVPVVVERSIGSMALASGSQERLNPFAGDEVRREGVLDDRPDLV